MESFNELILEMQTKVRKQLKISQLKEDFTKIGTQDIECYEQYVGIRSRHLKLVSELHFCYLKFCSIRQLYLKVTLLDPVVQQIAPLAFAMIANENQNV